MLFWVYILISFSRIASTEKISKSACDNNLQNNKCIEYSDVQNDFANITYVNQHKVHFKHFAYKSTGDNLQYPLSNAFDTSNTDTFWAASTPNNDTFHNSIIVKFNKPITIEAILYRPLFTTMINTDNIKIRIFNGSPKKLKIYTSLYNDNFKLESLFVGTPDTEWDQFQFVLPNSSYCDKIKLEFVEVTPDTLTSNGSYTPISRGITFLQKLNQNEQSLLSAVERAYCGNGCEYSVRNGELIIYTTETIPDIAPFNDQPWKAYENEINTISINNPTINIGTYTFTRMNNVQTVNFNSMLTTIGDFAFFSMDSLTEITLPSGVNSIGKFAFSKCPKLKAINVNSNNENYKSINGILFNYQMTTLIQYPPAKDLTSYSLPSTVKEVSYGAFAVCTNLKSFSTNNALTELDSDTYGMTNLKTFEIGSGVEKVYYYIFDDMISLQNIVVDTSNKKYSSDNGVLYNYDKSELLVYPRGKTATSFTILSTVSKINNNVFDDANYLQNFYVNSANIYFKATNGVLFSFDSKTLIRYPSAKGSSYSIPETVTLINPYAFYKATIEIVKMSNSVIEIGSNAFSYCRSLNSVTLSNNLEIINRAAFHFCIRLKSITIPEKVTTISESAFDYSGLVNVTILGNVDDINANAFNVNSLSYFLYMGTKEPNYVISSLYSNLVVFVVADYQGTSFCGNPIQVLYTRFFTKSNEFTTSSIFTASSEFTVSSGFTTSNSFTKSMQFTFSNEFSYSSKFTLSSNFSYSQVFSESNNFSLSDSFSKSAAFSYSNQFSKSSAFSESIPFEPTALLILNVSGSYGNTNYTIYEDELTISASGKLEKCDVDCPYSEFISEVEKIVISDDVTIIGKSAFSNFENLLTVEIPESVTVIEESAFQSCGNLTTIVIPNSVTEIGANCFNNCSSLQSVQFSNEITELPNGLFNGCINLETVTLPENVEIIGESCFTNCTNLVTITLPDTVNEIQSNAFSGCSKLTKIDIPNKVTTINSSTFSQCTSLESVSLNGNINQLQQYSFYNCTNLLFFEIKSTNLIIFDHSFELCINLNSFSIYGYLNSVGEYALAYCYSLHTFKITSEFKANLLNSDDVANYDSNTISSYAFYNCFELSSFNIPEGIVKIGNNSFDGCTNLQTLFIPSTVTEIGSKAFQNIRNIDIYFYGSEEPNYPPDLFSNTGVNHVYVSASYKGKLFEYNVEPIPVTQQMTHLLSKSITMVIRKSVTMSNLAVISNIISQTYDEEKGGYIDVISQSYVNQAIPYVIQYLSPSFVETYFSVIVVKNKSKISSEQLIGIVCGSASVFFLITGTIIFIIKKKKYPIIDYNVFYDLSDSEGMVITKKKKNYNEDEQSQSYCSFSTYDTSSNINTQDWSSVYI